MKFSTKISLAKNTSRYFSKDQFAAFTFAGWGLVKGKNRKHLILIFLVTLAIGILNRSISVCVIFSAEIVLVSRRQSQPKSMLNWIVLPS